MRLDVRVPAAGIFESTRSGGVVVALHPWPEGCADTCTLDVELRATPFADATPTDAVATLEVAARSWKGFRGELRVEPLP